MIHHTKYNYIVLKPTEEKIIKLLQIKSGLSISQIGSGLHLSRTSIYNSIESLVNKGIVSKDNFIYKIRDKKLINHEIDAIDTNTQIQKLFKELLTLDKGEIIYSIESDEEIKELFKNTAQLLNWQKSLTKKGIVLKGVGSEYALEFFKKNTEDKLNSILKNRSGSARFTNIPIPGYCTLIVFRCSIVFLSRKKRYFFRIDNEFPAQFLKELIENYYLMLDFEPITR